MDDSYRLKVLKALTAHLQLIVHEDPDPGNGIEGADFNGFDLSKAVFRGRSIFGDESPKTMLSILEAPRPDVGRTAGAGEARVETWQLLLQGWTPDDPENPTDNLYRLMQVVEVQLQKIVAVKPSTGKPEYSDAYMLGRTVTSFLFGPGVVRPPIDQVSSKAMFYMPLGIGLAKSVG